MIDRLLTGKRVLLGVTGGIAAYKAADLCSKLVQAGSRVDVIMTEAATRFVTPLTFSALNGSPARVDMWDAPGGDAIPHVRMASSADLVIVAPLSANTLAKLALGLADNLLTATLLASAVPWVLAPAMESHMWANPVTQGHAAALRARGAVLVGPGSGHLASGAEGIGRMAEPSQILDAVRLALAVGGPLAGRRVLVTAGGTQEPLDPVRFLTNASSGKMGVALAEAARDLGAIVTLVHAPLSVALPAGVECLPARSAGAMRDVVLSRLDGTDILIAAAAVADFRPAQVAPEKIKKGREGAGLTLELVRTPDILAEAAQRSHSLGWPRVVVGFAAETQDLLQNASAKLKAKRLDMIVANDVTQRDGGFGSDDNRVTLLYRDGRQEGLERMAKADVAERVLYAAMSLLAGAPGASFSFPTGDNAAPDHGR
jgi:phosphopantothenoylcysteine decarboxylase / phosphopantothenate---cysteine ligase